MALSVVSDLDARIDGAESRARLASVSPRSVCLDFGRSSLGRAVVSLSALDAILARFSTASFSVAARRSVSAITNAHLEGRGVHRLPAASAVDLVIDLAPRLSHRVEWSDDTLKLPSLHRPGHKQHAARHWLDAIRLAGFEAKMRVPELALPTAVLARGQKLARNLAGMSRPFVVLMPVAKRETWGADRFARLGRALEDRIGAQVVWTRDLPAVDAPTVAAFLSLAAVCVGDASGLTHLAAAVNAPVVAIHGRRCPVRHGPACELSGTVSATCVDEAHRPRTRRERCIECIQGETVASLAEELAARRWPWDRFRRFG